MSHRVHPKIYRIEGTTYWDSRWFDRKKLSTYLEEDFKIREFLKKKLKQSGLEKVEIERFPGKVIVIVATSRPGLVIGRGGAGSEDIKKDLEKILSKEPRFQQGVRLPEIKVEIKEIRNPWLSAELSGQWIAFQLEKRVRHRRVMKQALEKIMVNKEVKGARIELSGRLNGVEIARREWLKQKQMPRQTIRADIDYAQVEAYCTYGVLGIKVWIYKGERFAK